MSTSKETPTMEALTATLNSGPAQKRDDEFFRPRQQAYFYCGHDCIWRPAPSAQTISPPRALVNPKVIHLISWNIDMLVPFGNERMAAALQHLNTLIASTPPDIATIIFLQEMTQSDLGLIKSSAWIQDRFNITDIDSSSWLSAYYGTVTLIDTRLSISSVFRVPFLSKFDRDGLFVDIQLSTVKPTASSSISQKVLRLCNVHLESLVANPPVRPHQLSAAAAYLHAPEVASALLAGDLNAIEGFDRTLHSENDLQDAYLSLGGREDSEEGYTWGYQVPAPMRERFGCSRMDKILFCGDVNVQSFERIGAGVKVAEALREDVRTAGEEDWVSDHYGAMGDFELDGNWSLKTGESNEEV
jgi:tyrosyl-DNA phosphodiesterase 2